jgi:hypothetical protein
MLKQLNNKFTKGLLALAILLGGSLATYGAVKADTVVGEKPNPLKGIVVAISQKFGLSETEVQAVVDEQLKKQHAEMEAKIKQDFATKLTDAVKAGKLTQAQADLITAKQEEIRAQLETLKTNQTPPTKEQMKAFMEGLQTWATANNIPKEFMMFGVVSHKGGDHMLGGPGHFMIRIEKPDSTTTGNTQ